MKKEFKKLLEDLSECLREDSKSTSAIHYLLTKVDGLNDLKESTPSPENTDSGNGKFPIPKEIQGKKQSFALFSDGACRGNPGPGSWGTVGQNSLGEILFQSSGIDIPSTNNKMELEGAIQGLMHLKDYLQDLGTLDQSEVFLYSDSKYVVDGITKWVAGWKKRGWKKADKKAPENIEQWKRLDQVVLDYKHLHFLWVKGHAGHVQNEFCDALANQALDDSGF